MKTFLQFGFLFLWSFISVLAQSDSINVYPQQANYWTGTTDGVTKTDPCEVRAWDTEDGWMMFDVSSIPQNSVINSITFWGYVSATNSPYWSATPLPYNGVTASAADIYAAIQAGQGQGSAYLYRNEVSTFTTGWHTWVLGGNANADLQTSLPQGWFSIGIASRDNNTFYGLTFGGWCSPNPEYLVVHFSPLPVELTSFTANYCEGKVTLNWITATEENNRGFEIQRSEKENEKEWDVAGFVKGNGTTVKPHSYTYYDNFISPGEYSYRLKQIDYDGSYEYSDVINVSTDGELNFSLSQNYPNPFNPATVITYQLPVDNFVSLKVYNSLGEEVAVLINEKKPAGVYEVRFDGSRLTSGVYIYRLAAGTFMQVKKMILMK